MKLLTLTLNKLVSGIPKKMSQRMRAPIFNLEALEEEISLNKHETFGLKDINKNIFLHCYR